MSLPYSPFAAIKGNYQQPAKLTSHHSLPAMNRFFSLGVPALTACLLLLLLLQVFPPSEAALQCTVVLNDLSPCFGYLMSGNGSPSSACCSGLSSLVSAASTTPDRRTACSCIQSAAQIIMPNVGAAKALLKSCGVTLPFPISANMDCSKIT